VPAEAGPQRRIIEKSPHRGGEGLRVLGRDEEPVDAVLHIVDDAADAGGTFTGTVTFKDPELKTWTYKIKLKAGGAIKGTGWLTPEGVKTEKQLLGVARPMTVKEDLKAVSERDYKMYVNEMRPPGGAE